MLIYTSYTILIVEDFSCQEVIDLEDDLMTTTPKASSTIVIIDSDEEDDRDQTPLLPFQEVILPKPVALSTSKDKVVSVYLFC